MEEPVLVRRKRGLSSEDARAVRRRGHDDALEFALAIGLDQDYQNNAQAKKDVIDPSGDAHSVKSGVVKWQIFLYGLGRFSSDDAFGAMDGLGGLLQDCINCFPLSFADYTANKPVAKELLRIPMVKMAQKLQDKTRLRAFLNKALFNGGEVDYLTVKQDGVFHVFLNKDVIQVMGDNFEVCNSRARSAGQFSEQKVLFRFNGINLGELEMRNDSLVHYREIRFNMIKPKVMGLLFTHILQTRQFNERVYLYGNASRKFGRWQLGQTNRYNTGHGKSS